MAAHLLIAPPFKEVHVDTKLVEHAGDGAAVARYGALVRGRLAGWFEGAAPGEYARVIAVYYGPQAAHELLERTTWHAAQHLSFFVTALFFWSAMLGPRRNAWIAAFCLFATSMITGALGAFMALSESPWYGPYAALGLAAFGLTPAEDQQLAGLLMWVPGGLLHAIVAVAILAPHLRSAPMKEARDG